VSTKYREPGFPACPVGLFARSVGRGTRRDVRTLSRLVYTSARRTAEQCIAICTPYDCTLCNCAYVCIYIYIYASSDYVATLLFQRCPATRSDSVTVGTENEIRSNETLTRWTACHTAHTRIHTYSHVYMNIYPRFYSRGVVLALVTPPRITELRLPHAPS